MDQKKELGKGIRALLGGMDSKKPNAAHIPHKPVPVLASVQMISIDQINPNPYQPRHEFAQNELQELAKSIKSLGIIQPITVRKVGEQNYQLISGERRTRAAKLAGLKEIPAYTRSANDQGMLEMALVENIQRENLNAIDIAISMARLIEECKLTHDTMAERLGKERSTITNYLRLLKLPPDIQQAVKNKKLSMGHARALAGITNLVLQMKLYKETLLHEWSVRKLEQAIQTYEKPAEKKALKKLNNTSSASYVDKINAIFGRKTQLKTDKKGKGNIIVPVNSFDDISELIDYLS